MAAPNRQQYFVVRNALKRCVNVLRTAIRDLPEPESETGKKAMDQLKRVMRAASKEMGD